MLIQNGYLQAKQKSHTFPQVAQMYWAQSFYKLAE